MNVAFEVARSLIYVIGPSGDRSLGEGISGLVAEVIDLRGVPRAHIVVGPDGRRRLEYAKDSFWGLPPVDMGELQSGSLDDFLYGEP